MCTSENLLGIEVAYLFELRSEICLYELEYIAQLLSFNGSLGYQ